MVVDLLALSCCRHSCIVCWGRHVPGQSIFFSTAEYHAVLAVTLFRFCSLALINVSFVLPCTAWHTAALPGLLSWLLGPSGRSVTAEEVNDCFIPGHHDWKVDRDKLEALLGEWRHTRQHLHNDSRQCLFGRAASGVVHTACCTVTVRMAAYFKSGAVTVHQAMVVTYVTCGFVSVTCPLHHLVRMPPHCNCMLIAHTNAPGTYGFLAGA